MAYTDTWNAAFEAEPQDGDDIADGAAAVRDLVLAIRERMQSDHYWAPAGTDADHGEHTVVVFNAPTPSISTLDASKGALFSRDVDSKAELHYLDEDDNVITLTKAGNVASGVPSGTTMLIESDTAISGFTLLVNDDNYLVYIGSGSGEGGLEGDTYISGGTWTQPDHTHGTDHNHIWYKSNGGSADDGSYKLDGVSNVFNTTIKAYLKIDLQSTASAGMGENDGGDVHWHTNNHDEVGGATANTWRPPGIVYTRQQKD